MGTAAPLMVIAGQATAQQCARTLTADVVALEQTIFYNRLGAFDPGATMFALRRDVVPIDPALGISAGNVRLRDGKRPRPLTLRMNEGDCLAIRFQNLLSPTRRDASQPATRSASVHVQGLHLVGSIADDGSNVGANASSLVAPGGTATYTLYGDTEGTYFLYSSAVNTGGDDGGGSISNGLFGAVNVEPRGAEWYRSQLTAEEMNLATRRDSQGSPLRTPDGHPVLDYDALYPAGHPFAGLPILRMLDAENRIVHGDLNAIITGPARGRFPSGTFPTVRPNRERHEPFREFTVIFHDQGGIVQAFDVFQDPRFEHTLHGGRDAFAINYGTGGVGAEILSNRFGVGPMWNCPECKFEEFFLSSWAVGDPAMVVDVPANVTDAAGQLITGPKATRVYYPDDPSNVHHSYLNDHVKFRNIHAGPREHHIFHLHGHQWLHNPSSDQSGYLDSQAIGPGNGWTYEIAYDGSGNRNKTPGDAIFHCHFYPHFAQGMWGLWRIHDVFESGTALDADGRPLPGARALPDGEIAAGTPIPGVVPIPGKALAPTPTEKFAGFPFYIPGVAGHRAPRPPQETKFDGGLPRHVVTGGEAKFPELNALDFHKESVVLQAVELPEEGTEAEQRAMKFHSEDEHSSYRFDPITGAVSKDVFRTNGLPAAPGAPFADPCVADDGSGPAGTPPRVYKGASFQTDVKYNKKGWHFPQHRMYALWADVDSIRDGIKAPEPILMRARSGECVQYHFVNLIPLEYQLDDFQVRTPTDVVGQHIHLVKFDLTSSDGSANGFNYEDGSLAPGEVRERVHAINAAGGLRSPDGLRKMLEAQAHPFFGEGPDSTWVGAMETVQRWYVDDLLNSAGQDRTIGTIFTHDHFGPSTHQQAGLYGAVVAEPAGSTWRNPETGEILGGRFDGGPTSWRADILTANPDSSYREFLLASQDRALAYTAAHQGLGPNSEEAIDPPGLNRETGLCRNGTAPPCPEIITRGDVGTQTTNYRNEPSDHRSFDPVTGDDAEGDAGDPAHLYRSIPRADPAMNTQTAFYPPLTSGTQGTDPFTPLLRAYEGDSVQLRLLVGAHESMHWFTASGLRWLFERTDPNSGYRNSQPFGISEHFEMQIKVPAAATTAERPFADYLWSTNAASTGVDAGMWGLLRAYDGAAGLRSDLLPLPNNPDGKALAAEHTVCPAGAPIRRFQIAAVTAGQSLPDGTLVYNSRGSTLKDPRAMLYVRRDDVNASGKLKPGRPIEPLVLRAAAGDCIEVTLENLLDEKTETFDGGGKPSPAVGLHAQLLSYDVTQGGGLNVGGNPVQTVTPGNRRTYRWYAGVVRSRPDGTVAHVPVEFGGVGLLPADPMNQRPKGLVGALIVEPQGSSWTEDAWSRASATVTRADGTRFRDFVAVLQDNVELEFGGKELKQAVRSINYRTEPQFLRLGYDPADGQLLERTDLDVYASNAATGSDPQTPVFVVEAGMEARIHFLQPGGSDRGQVMAVHGHSWQETPYVDGSTKIGDNPLSNVGGSEMGIGPSRHFDVVIPSAGGSFKVPGDYQIRTHSAEEYEWGLWAILRVVAPSGSGGSTTP